MEISEPTFYFTSSTIFLVITIVILFYKKVSILNAVFYYPILLITFAIGCISIRDQIFELNKEETGFVVFIALNIMAISMIVLFTRKRHLTLKQEEELLNFADKTIASYIILNKINVNSDDIRFVQNSNLTMEEKMEALHALDSKKMESKKEIYKEYKDKYLN